MRWLVLCLMLSGCIAPAVEITKIVHVHTTGNVTVNMNSGTSVEAEIDQDVKDVLKIPIVP